MKKALYTLDTVLPSIEPIPKGPGTEGCGEGVDYGGDHFYYTVGRRIPKDKVVALRSESGYCGRVHGEVEYLIVAWNGESFTILQRSLPGFLQKDMAAYHGCPPERAVASCKAHMNNLRKLEESRPKCACGKPILVIGAKQRKNECFPCSEKRLEKKHAV